MTSIDVCIEIYKRLNVPAVTSLLGAGKVWQHNRPVNSPNTDVVVSIPMFEGNARSVSYVDVNIHTPNLKEYYPIAGEDPTFPDMAKFKQLTEAILPLLGSTAGFTLDVSIPGVPVRDSDGQWFTNIRAGFKVPGGSESWAATLVTYASVSDGSAGHTSSRQNLWSGQVLRELVRDGHQLRDQAAHYAYIEQATWFVPLSAGEIPKAAVLEVGGRECKIMAFTEMGGFWRVETASKDGYSGT